MASIWEDILDIVAVVVGVIVDVASAGALSTVGNALVAFGVGDLIRTNVLAPAAAATEKAQLGQEGDVGSSGSTGGLTDTDYGSDGTGTGKNRPTTTVQKAWNPEDNPNAHEYIVPTAKQIVAEREELGEEEQAAYEQQALSDILNLKSQELAAESTIVSNTAARGLRIGQGTPAIQVAYQQEKGAAVIGGAEQQVATGVAEIYQQRVITENTGLLNVSNANLSITEQYQQEMSNMWLSELSTVFGAATSALKLWNPDTTGQQSAASATPSYYNPAWQETNYGSGSWYE